MTERESLQFVHFSCVVCRRTRYAVQGVANITENRCRHVGTPLAVAPYRAGEPNTIARRDDKAWDEFIMRPVPAMIPYRRRAGANG